MSRLFTDLSGGVAKGRYKAKSPVVGARKIAKKLFQQDPDMNEVEIIVSEVNKLKPVEKQYRYKAERVKLGTPKLLHVGGKDIVITHDIKMTKHK